MRIRINLSSKDNIILPKSYNHQVQSFIYKHLDADFNNLHNEGYTYHKREFKLFTFSKVRTQDKSFKPYIKDNHINLGKRICVYVSSIDDSFIENLSKNLLTNREIILNNNRLKLHSIFPEDPDRTDKIIKRGEIKVKTISPVVIYSTDSQKKRIYHSPFDDDYSIRVKNNLINKYKAYNGVDEVNGLDFEIKVSKGHPIKSIAEMFKNTYIQGYYGSFMLSGSEELLRLAYYCGIGSKNSQGFGFLNVLRQKTS
jgi:CRISPR-associated endoribonuclease Cas6